MRIPLALLALASSWHSVLALDLKGWIQWNELCRGLGDLGQASVVLDHGKLHGSVTRDGSFTIPDVPAGTYILSVSAHDYSFEKLRIDVFESESLPEVRPYISGTPLSPASPVTLSYPIALHPRQKNDYFVPPESFNVLAMLNNPMMLMMAGVGAMVLLMPYLMKNMDPEALQDLKERQARMSSIQSSLQSGDIKSGFSALMSGADEPKAATSGAAKQSSGSGVKNRSGKNKRR